MTAPLDPGVDDQIIRWMKAGEERGLVALLSVHGPRVSGVLRQKFDRKVPDSMLLDALHDTAMQLFARPAQLDGTVNLGGLLFTSTWHEALRKVKADQAERNAQLPEGIDFAAPVHVAETAPDGRGARIAAAIADLSPLERDILDLEVVGNFGMTAKQIAAALGTTEQCVFATRSRIKQKLRKFVPDPVPERSRA